MVVRQQAIERARGVRLAVFDVDGVLTDGRLFLGPDGEEIKAFHTLDGHGLKMLQASGVQAAIITGRTSRSVELRARNLGIAHLMQGIDNKRIAFESLLADLGLTGAQAACMGDDVVDLPMMTRAGLAVAGPAAPQLVRERAHYVTAAAGGCGEVRECCEFIMRAQGTLEIALRPYLE